MSRRSNEQSLGSVIKDLLRVYGLNDRMDEIEVKDAWIELMGAAIDHKTRGIRLKKGVLSIQFDSGVLKEEFSFAKEKIKVLINDKIGREVIQEVRIW